MCGDWKHHGGRSDPSRGSQEGLTGGGDEGIASMEEVGNGAPETLRWLAIWDADSSLP